MDLIDALQEEHREALRRLDRLEPAFADLLDGSGAVRAEALARVEEEWEWFRSALVLHFRKEEEALFPVARGAAAARDGTLATLREEHLEFEEMRSQVVGALDTLRHGCCGRREGARRLRRAGTGLCAHLREHIWKEDQVLFPRLREAMGESLLAEAARAAAALGAGAPDR